MIIQKKFEIIENSQIAKDFFCIKIKSPQLAKKTLPGQFISVLVKDRHLLLRRPFSIFDCEKDFLKIIYKVIGKGTRALSLLKAGDPIDILGPLGNGFNLKNSNRKILAGGGIGIAPLYLLAKKLGYTKKITVLLGAKAKDELICEKDFKKLGCMVLTATEDGSRGKKGFVTSLLETELKNGCAEIFSCGPKGMLRAVSDMADRYQCPAQLSMEEYMACGFGVCAGCVVRIKSENGGDFDYQRVCKEGPVFESKKIVWE